MKVTETGEAFFVFETDEKNVPEELITSPLAQAISDSDVASGNVPSELQGLTSVRARSEVIAHAHRSPSRSI